METTSEQAFDTDINIEQQKFIYCLLNKKGDICYVGVTNNLYRRIFQHYSNKKDIFGMYIITVVWYNDPFLQEERWINLLLNLGHPLNNIYYTQDIVAQLEYAEIGQYESLLKRVNPVKQLLQSNP